MRMRAASSGAASAEPWSSSKLEMSTSRSSTASSTSRFFATMVLVWPLTSRSCTETNFSSVNDSLPGSSTSDSWLTSLRLRSIRFSTRSRILTVSSSRRVSPLCSECMNASMFIDVHVSVSMPGWMRRCMSSMCGLSSADVTGSTRPSTRSYWSSA